MILGRSFIYLSCTWGAPFLGAPRLCTVRLGECRNEYDIGQNPNTD